MSLQVGSLVKVPMADRALVRGVVHVEDFVNGQRTRLAESFAALGTLEGLFFGMDVTMIPEMVLPAESFAADITVKRPLVGVSTLVDQQVVRLGELAVAVFADETLLRPR